MNSTQEAALKREGQHVCNVLKLKGYSVQEVEGQGLSWNICSKDGDRHFQLTYLPTPVNDWSILPNNERLNQLVSAALTHQRGEFAKFEEIRQTYQRCEQPEDYSRPWAILRLLPNFRRYTVARFFNRQDAQDHLRTLNRMMPASDFALIFDLPPEHEQTY